MRRVLVVMVLGFSTGAFAQIGAQSPNEPGYTVPGANRSGEKPRLNEPARTFHGEVRDVDKVSGTITLRHGPINSLGVSEGTKDYPVKDASMLEKIKVGDEVRFAVVLQGRSLLVTYIAPEK